MALTLALVVFALAPLDEYGMRKFLWMQEEGSRLLGHILFFEMMALQLTTHPEHKEVWIFPLETIRPERGCGIGVDESVPYKPKAFLQRALAVAIVQCAYDLPNIRRGGVVDEARAQHEADRLLRTAGGRL